MKHVILALLLLPAPALAQQPQPPAPTDLLQQQQLQQQPLQQQWQEEGATPTPSLNAPVPPDQQTDQQAGQQQQTAPAPLPDDQAPATFARPNVWVPATGAKVQALDKVNARSKDFSIKVGQSATFGSLTITVKACVVRPADQPADAAAFLDVTDSHPDSGNFNGWMLEKEPSVSMMQNPIYDLRVDGCT